jgi:hypothetical protein
MPSDQWAGRLLVGTEEVGSFDGYASTQAVEQAIRETGRYPDTSILRGANRRACVRYRAYPVFR